MPTLDHQHNTDTMETGMEYEQLDANDNVNINMQKIFNLLQDNSMNLKSYRAEINEKFESLNNRCNVLEAHNRELTDKFNFVYDKCQVLESGLSNIQQQQIENNIVIRGTPEIETNDNELKNMIKAVLLALGINLDIKTIITAFRIGKKKDSTNGNHSKRPIVVKLTEHKLKEAILEAKRKKKLTCNTILVNNKPMGAETDQIYIDEQLVQHKLKLFHEARQFKKQGSIKFLWTKNGRILLREKEKEPVKEIEHEGHIDDLYLKFGSNVQNQPQLDPAISTSNNRGKKRPNQTSLTEEARRNLRPRIGNEKK